ETLWLRLIAEISMRPMIARQRFPQVVWAIGLFGFIGLLTLDPRVRKHPVRIPGRDLVADDRFIGRVADENVATIMLRGEHDRIGRHLRLEDRAHGSWLVRQA